MSGPAMLLAERQILPKAHAIVLRTIANSINHRLGFGWKSQEDMAASSNGMSWSHFKRCLKDLGDLGLIIVGRQMVRGRWLTVYRIDKFRLVRWDPRNMKWKQFLTEEIARRTADASQAGETKQAFVQRRLAEAGFQ